MRTSSPWPSGGHRRLSVTSVFLALVLSASATFIEHGGRSTASYVLASQMEKIYRRQLPSDTNFNWTAVIPSEKLDWTPCYSGFECARFAVPLDYSDPTNGQEAAVTVIKFPSPIQPGQDGYKGPLLFNPGGPGAPGVPFVLESAQGIRKFVGDAFDIVGFDPRGIGYTTPGMFAFQPGPEDAVQFGAIGKAANETPGALGALYAEAQTIGKVAKVRVGDVARFVSTSAVARDMMGIVNAFGDDLDSKLQYWGFSHGSALGATFAAMFPNNVGCLIIDGVVDSEAYYSGQYGHELEDTDKAPDRIYQACVDAGPPNCPIFEPSTSAIRTRVNRFLESLKTRPLSFFTPSNGSAGEAYGVLDYSAAKNPILSVLYKPYDPHVGGAALLAVLGAAEQRGDAGPLFGLTTRGPTSDAYECPAGAGVPFASGFESSIAVKCGDTVRPTPPSLEEMRALYGEMALESEMFWEMLSAYLVCGGWTIKSKEPFTPDFRANTSFPILVIGNTADPVTPLSSARKLSELFLNSVLLTQDSAGHTSLAANSTCATKVVIYLQDGQLLEKGIICDIESAVYPK